jgi:hypothetical protein
VLYALKNRAEWELYGLEIVAEMMEAYEAALESPNGPPLSRPISELATHTANPQPSTDV